MGQVRRQEQVRGWWRCVSICSGGILPLRNARDLTSFWAHRTRKERRPRGPLLLILCHISTSCARGSSKLRVAACGAPPPCPPPSPTTNLPSPLKALSTRNWTTRNKVCSTVLCNVCDRMAPTRLNTRPSSQCTPYQSQSSMTRTLTSMRSASVSTCSVFWRTWALHLHHYARKFSFAGQRP